MPLELPRWPRRALIALSLATSSPSLAQEQADTKQGVEAALGESSALQTFNSVSGDYQNSNENLLEAVRVQLSKYNETWISQLPNQEQAEAYRQWAYCLQRELYLEITQRTRSSYSGFEHLAFQSPETEEEYKQNQTVLTEALNKLAFAIEHGDSTTKQKAENLQRTLRLGLQHMENPAEKVPVQETTYPISEFFTIDAPHKDWPVDAIQIRLTEEQSKALKKLPPGQYTLLTADRYDSRAGGELILCKDGKPVDPPVKLTVYGLTRTVAGFPIDVLE